MMPNRLLLQISPERHDIEAAHCWHVHVSVMQPKYMLGGVFTDPPVLYVVYNH